MSDRLAGHAAYITGGATGIGASCASRFAAHGARVVICHLPHQAGEAAALIDTIHAAGGVGFGVVCDVTSPGQVQHSFDEAVALVGAIDVVVTAAGVATAPGQDHHTNLIDLTPEHWQFVLDVNVTGTLNTARVAATRMIDGGFEGSIITLASFAAKRPTRGVYSVSKAAVWMLTRALAGELGPHGIRVNSIGPGIIDTSMLGDAANIDVEQWKREQVDRISLRRIGQPDDVAKVALFLASDDSAYLTGAILHPDGGLTSSFAGG